MPFTGEGIVPDVIINPHAIPSRMTVNQLIELVLGKACCLNGESGDATPFGENSTDNAAERICEILRKAGMKHGMSYNKHGWETLYNGFTGEPMDAQIFMGPTYYQRLKHMVSSKMHSRSEGQKTTLCRQPTEGRSRDGGLRFGEMERDCIISHGGSSILKERLFVVSDPYQIIVCNECGQITSSQKECKACNTDKITKCNIPYAAKLLIQMTQAMMIKTTIVPR